MINRSIRARLHQLELDYVNMRTQELEISAIRKNSERIAINLL